MTIRLKCDCGREIAARDDWAGRKVACPACKAPVLVSAPPGSECPNCHRVNPVGSPSCAGCGYDFGLGRVPLSVSKPEEKHPGLFGLMLGTLVHPFDTMDAFFYYVNDRSMLIKMAVFYFCTVPVAGLAHAGGMEHLGKGILIELATFAIATICIVGAGALLGQSSNILGAALILGFVRAVTYAVMGLYVIALLSGLTDPLPLVLLVFLIWNILLYIAALTNIFGCSWQLALLIAIVAGILQGWGARFLGLSG